MHVHYTKLFNAVLGMLLQLGKGKRSIKIPEGEVMWNNEPSVQETTADNDWVQVHGVCLVAGMGKWGFNDTTDAERSFCKESGHTGKLRGF